MRNNISWELGALLGFLLVAMFVAMVYGMVTRTCEPGYVYLSESGMQGCVSENYVRSQLENA